MAGSGLERYDLGTEPRTKDAVIARNAGNGPGRHRYLRYVQDHRALSGGIELKTYPICFRTVYMYDMSP